MKKVLIGSALMTLMAAAWAQSSVTLYGRLDVSANYLGFNSTTTKPSTHLKTLSSDGSVLGFRGSEDFGGGQRAYFKLESGVQYDTGAQAGRGDQFWNRESYVGLGDANFGAIQLGSQYPTFIFASVKVDPFIRYGDASFINLLQGVRGFPVASYNNSIEYVSPTLAGLSGRALVSAGEGAVTGRSFSGMLEYASGPAYVDLIYDQMKNTAAQLGVVGAPRWSKSVAIGATYDLNFVKLHGWLQNNRVENLHNINGYMAGVSVPIGQSSIRATYTHRSALNADASLWGAGYFYFLSKRTSVYAEVGRLNNSGTAAFTMGPAYREQGAAGLPSAGQNINGVQLGVQHTF